jgi:hypothetical protein
MANNQAGKLGQMPKQGELEVLGWQQLTRAKPEAVNHHAENFKS